MKLVDSVDSSLFVSESIIQEELRKLLRMGVFKAETVRALESASVIIDAYANGREEDYEDK